MNETFEDLRSATDQGSNSSFSNIQREAYSNIEVATAPTHVPLPSGFPMVTVPCPDGTTGRGQTVSEAIRNCNKNRIDHWTSNRG